MAIEKLMREVYRDSTGQEHSTLEAAVKAERIHDLRRLLETAALVSKQEDAIISFIVNYWTELKAVMETIRDEATWGGANVAPRHPFAKGSVMATRNARLNANCTACGLPSHRCGCGED